MKVKHWNITVIGLTVVSLILLAIPTIIVDPYFHYHKPLGNMKYILNNERYQNDGIIKHFEYNAMITGTSMTENFKTTEFDKIFDAKSIKVPFSGAGYKEIDKNIRTALEYNNNLKYVLRSLDLSTLVLDKDYMRLDSYPTYLYDKNIFNDVSYILNKSVLAQATFNSIKFNMNGGVSTTFDDYANWNSAFIFDKKTVLSKYTRPEISAEKIQCTQETKKLIIDNIQQNVVETAQNNPDTTFLLFFTPYSIVYWDSVVRSGKLDYEIETQRIAIEELLKCKNIKLYGFSDQFDMVCQLDNYKDQAHYGQHINTKMLYWIKDDVGLLTKDNYMEYLNKIKDFYANYDYDGLIFNDDNVK